MRRAVAADPRSLWSIRLVWIGVISGACVVPLVFLPAGGSAFGPPKAVVLASSAFLVTLGFVLEPARLQLMLRNAQDTWMGKASLLLFAAALVSTMTAPVLRTAVLGHYPDYRGLMTLLACMTIGLGAASLRPAESLVRQLSRGASVALAVIGFVAAGEAVGLPPAALKAEGAVRAISTVGNASNLAVVAALMLPLALSCAVGDARRAWRTAGLLGTAGGVVALSWSLSRGAWIGLVVAAVTAGLLAWAGGGKQLRAAEGRRATRAVAIVVASALVASAIAMPAVLPRLERVFDTSSATVVWRLSTWESAADMVSARPLRGFGPSGFRLGYLPFKAPGQDDGRLGYVPTEAAHNVVLDTGVSFGILGVLAVTGLVVATARFLVLERVREHPRARLPVAVGSALAGGFVALLFHYVTLDSGPMLAALLGVVLSAEGATRVIAGGRDSSPAPSRNIWRAAALVAALLFLAWALATAMLTWADTSVGRILAGGTGDSSWERTRTDANRSVGMAFWEPAVARNAGRAAGSALGGEGDADALQDGMRLYARAVKLMPGDPYIKVEYARFLMYAASRVHDPELLDRADSLARAAVAEDVSSGLPHAVLGRVSLLRGNPASAVDLLEAAVSLSPLSGEAWDDLVRAYRLLGDQAGARSAEERAGAALAGQP